MVTTFTMVPATTQAGGAYLHNGQFRQLTSQWRENNLHNGVTAFTLMQTTFTLITATLTMVHAMRKTFTVAPKTFTMVSTFTMAPAAGANLHNGNVANNLQRCHNNLHKNGATTFTMMPTTFTMVPTVLHNVANNFHNGANNLYVANNPHHGANSHSIAFTKLQQPSQWCIQPSQWCLHSGVNNAHNGANNLEWRVSSTTVLKYQQHRPLQLSRLICTMLRPVFCAVLQACFARCTKPITNINQFSACACMQSTQMMETKMDLQCSTGI